LKTFVFAVLSANYGMGARFDQAAGVEVGYRAALTARDRR
jgi:hypothetical protein